jgi:hypothetical protein
MPYHHTSPQFTGPGHIFGTRQDELDFRGAGQGTETAVSLGVAEWGGPCAPRPGVWRLPAVPVQVEREAAGHDGTHLLAVQERVAAADGDPVFGGFVATNSSPDRSASKI